MQTHKWLDMRKTGHENLLRLDIFNNVCSEAPSVDKVLDS